jgi:aromatic ring-opening dioxygenase LigB subunit
MPLIFGCISPHGFNILPEVAPTPKTVAATRASMTTMGARLQALKPDTVIVLTPHGIRIEGAMCISVSTRAAGDWGPVEVAFDVDQELAGLIADAAESAGVRTAKCIYGASGGPMCAIPLDWGALIPLRFMGDTYDLKPRVVVICPSREISREQQVAFGRTIAEVAEASPKRIALIASADQGHAHSDAGPHGYHPAAAKYDALMQKVVQEERLEALLTVDETLVREASCDSLWQTLILAGALQVRPFPCEYLSYEIDDYYGMLCAVYQD